MPVRLYLEPELVFGAQIDGKYLRLRSSLFTVLEVSQGKSYRIGLGILSKIGS